MPGLKNQGEPEQRRQVHDQAKCMPGLRLRTKVLDAEGGQSLANALPLSSSGALRTDLGLPFATARPQGEEDSDSLDTSAEYALAEPGKPRFERAHENGTILVDSGAAEAST